MHLQRTGFFGGLTATLRAWRAITVTVVAMPLALGGCNVAPRMAAPAMTAPPTVLEISPEAATGPDYVADGSIETAGETVSFQLELVQAFNTVVVMTSGDTDTAGRVETEHGDPVTEECEGKAWNAVPPCVWGNDDDVATPNAERTREYNAMASSRNFLWEGSLDEGTYFIRVTGEQGATGAFRLTVETNNRDCPYYFLDHPFCTD